MFGKSGGSGHLSGSDSSDGGDRNEVSQTSKSPFDPGKFPPAYRGMGSR